MQERPLIMEEIFAAAKKLPAVIPPKMAKVAYDAAWEGYIREIASEVRVGSGLTIIGGDGSRNLGDIAHEALHKK